MYDWRREKDVCLAEIQILHTPHLLLLQCYDCTQYQCYCCYCIHSEAESYLLCTQLIAFVHTKAIPSHSTMITLYLNTSHIE
jgi:hypothetical protein